MTIGNKKINLKKLCNFLAVGFVFLAFLGQVSFAYADSQIDSQQESQSKEQIITDETGTYKLKPTPFGFVKQKIGPGTSSKLKNEQKSTNAKALSETKKKKTKPLLTDNEDLIDPKHVQTSSDNDEVIFNFDRADLNEVIRTMAEILDINYMVDTNISGSVDIHTAGTLAKEDVFPIFFQILEANGLAAVKEGNIYKIVSSQDIVRIPMPHHYGQSLKKRPIGERVVFQIIPLKYIDSAEMTKLLNPFISSNGQIISYPDANIILLIDRSISVVKALELVKVFDVDIFKNVHHRFFTIKNTTVDSVSKLLKQVAAVYDKKNDLELITITNLNTLLVLSKDVRMIDVVEKYIPQLDIAAPAEDFEPKIFVYWVKNGQAGSIGGLLRSVIGQVPIEEKIENIPTTQNEKKEAKSTKTKPSPFGDLTTRPASEKKQTPGNSPGIVLSALKNKINIISDAVRNALIITATPSDYRIIEDILKKIDVLPRQVLIEVTIAEIQLDESTDLGVEWNFSEPGGLKTNVGSGSVSEQGLAYALGLSEKWNAAISALAQEKKVNILSSPSVLASDNKEARINISTQVPVATTETQYDSGTDIIVQTKIQYRDTGVILSVTPHINERGLVSMEIVQEISEQGSGIQVGGNDYPSFRERKVNTTLTVKHGQTVVIGGLITESKDGSKLGIPFLSRIPYLGFIFGSKSDSYNKNELIILITPRVIISIDDIDDVSNEFKSKVSQMNKQFN